MPSFNNPQPTNAILDDIVDIRELLRLNVKWDPTSAADIPAGAKRLVEVTGGWQIQIYDGAGWASIGKLMHGSGSIDGYTVSTSAKAGCIPVYNANAQLVGSITGNAATATKLATARSIDIGGIATADAQSFNGTANITIPITRITVNNDNDDALNGEVSKLHGGTGRTDGAAADVIVDSIVGNVKASEYGQIGNTVSISESVDLDSLVVQGNYMCNATQGVAKNHPETLANSLALVRVYRRQNFIMQLWSFVTRQYARQSTNGGASWGGWHSLGGVMGGNINIYISKSGSDSNTGLDSAYPVLTIGRAIRLAYMLMTGVADSNITLRIGAGDWGNLTMRGFSGQLRIMPYDGVAHTEYSDELPVFNNLSFYGCQAIACVSLVVNVLGAFNSSFVGVPAGYKRFGRVTSNTGSLLYFDSSNAATNVLEIIPQTVNTAACFDVHNFGKIYFEYLNIKIASNLTYTSAFISVGNGAEARFSKGRTVFNVSGGSVTGMAYSIGSGAKVVVANDRFDGDTPEWFSTVPGTVAGILSKGCIINGFTIGGAVDDKVVHLAGTETIVGAKTFTAKPTIKMSSPQIAVIQTDISAGTAPAANQFANLVFYDASVSAVALGKLEHLLTTAGASEVLIQAIQSKVGGGGVSCSIKVGVAADGSYYTFAPHPPAGDSSNKIATTNWVKSNVTTISPATAPPKALGTAAVGSSAKYAREDHVHPLPSKFQDNAITTIRAIEFGGAGTGEGGLIDFHWGGTTADYTSRIIESSSGILTVNGLAISDGYASAKLRSKGSRSTDGTWSITGCTIGAPLLILHKGGSGTSTGTSVQMYVSSGGTGGNRSYGRYMLGTSTNEADMHGNVFVTIPTATTVNISVTGCADDGDVLYAYQ